MSSAKNVGVSTQPLSGPREIREIALSNSPLVTIVDYEDYEWLSVYRWRLQPGHGSPYIGTTTGTKGKILLMHRLIMGATDGSYVDHRDRDTLNNRRENLRFCTASQNQGNSIVPLGASGYRGVSQAKNRWFACIKRFGKRVYLGSFATPEEAAHAYDLAALDHWGEFARLNLPDLIPDQLELPLGVKHE